ncbi:hypothetical protein ACQ86N_08390 [Puia sp. P3]|uniref:hypothetical protein n=1 Tax=Puia sp. P3 TaxID=3423952 RepID=UPI003D67F229
MGPPVNILLLSANSRTLPHNPYLCGHHDHPPIPISTSSASRCTPFTIATGTMHYAQNILIRVHTDAGYYGVGECSAFPMIVGETHGYLLRNGKGLRCPLEGKDALATSQRMQELHDFTAFNATIKSAFDIALHDLAAKAAGQPLYKFLGGKKKDIETDLTIGIDTPENMAQKAIKFKQDGVRMIKIKLGRTADEDILRVRLIRQAVGRTSSSASTPTRAGTLNPPKSPRRDGRSRRPVLRAAHAHLQRPALARTAIIRPR